MALKKREIQVDSEKVRGKKSKKIDFSREVISEYEPENLTEPDMVDGKKGKKKVSSTNLAVDNGEQLTEPIVKNVKKAKKKARVVEEVIETPADYEDGTAEPYTRGTGDNDLYNLANSGTVNGKKAKKKVPSENMPVENGKQLIEPLTKNVKKAKKKARIAEQNETLANNEEGSAESYTGDGKKSKKAARILDAQEVNGENGLYNLTDPGAVKGKKAKAKVSAKNLIVDDTEQPSAKKIKKAKKIAPTAEDVEISADYHEVAAEPVSETGKKSKKKARILDAQDVNEENDLCTPVNGKKAKKKVPAKDLAVDNEEQLAEPPAKKIKKSKKKAAISEQLSQTIVDAVDPFEKFHQPHEAADHWQLRRMFLEQNFDVLPEDELECLAQVFINVELLRCDYPPETMARLEELSGGISAKYHEQRRYGPHRTLVSATYVAALKAQRKELVIPKKVEDASTEATLHLDGVKNGPDPFVPIDGPKNLTEMLQNVIVINDCFEATLSAWKPLNRECGFEFIEHEQRGGFLLNVKAHVGGRNYVIGKAEGAVGGKPLKKQAIADAMKYLYEHCYSLVRKKAPTEMSGLSVIPKTILESIDSEQIKGEKANKNDGSMAEIHTKLGESNMGFRLLEKMGWKGGSLGVRGDGIVDPVEATMKAGRRGLGHEKAAESEGEFSIKAVRQELYALRDGTQSQHIVFSKDFTKPERAKIHKMALGMGLKTKSFGSDKTGDRQLVVYALQLSPHQILKKVLVEKDPFYCEMYEAKCPTKLTAI